MSLYPKEQLTAHHSDREMADYSFHSFVAGGVGGVAVVLIGFPFDTIKVLLQTQSHTRLPDILTAVYRNTLSNGLLRGLSWPLCSVPFTNAVFFGVNNTALSLFNKEHNPADVDWRSRYIAGCIGSLAEMTFVIPIDYVKVVLQSQAAASQWQREIPCGQTKYFRGPLDVGRYILVNNGLVGLYKGASLMLCREIPLGGLFMVNFHQIQHFLQERGLTDSHGLVADSLGGGFAGCINWGVGMPIDVIKSRYQGDMVGQYKSITDCAYRSFKTEGIRVFFRGTLVTFLRAFPVNAANTCIVFQTLKLLQRPEDKQN
ncbi:solute carrier family 25 member 45-like [Pecten maximus]|uniref:solute carrier family 25 member 45-like n=1 Tax=Pecten maximus TaxID=6579 RepID=UPI0014591A2B|nr:solute carrier family 25 member 45-like [Pecten maximus]